MGKTNELSEFAAYFGIAERLAPHMAFLLEDFTELGSEPELIASWLAEHGLDRSSRVLDLGCGKGAVALAVASRLGARLDGIDLYEPFVEAARSSAAEAGIEHLCSFACADLRDALRGPVVYDAALFVSVGVALGDYAETIRRIRPWVRPGGVIVIDDAYRPEGALGRLNFPGYESTPTLDAARAQLTSSGDRLAREQTLSRATSRAQNRRYMGWIEARAAKLARREPDLAADIDAYVQKEREEVQLLESHLHCATWMIERR